MMDFFLQEKNITREAEPLYQGTSLPQGQVQHSQDTYLTISLSPEKGISGFESILRQPSLIQTFGCSAFLPFDFQDCILLSFLLPGVILVILFF